MTGQPVILDFDASVLRVSKHELRIPLSEWQEAVRFGCTLREFERLEARLEKALPPKLGCVFTGSGDFHHVSLLLLRRLDRRLPAASLDLVVCDNHPDNMRYPFGLHCGSWVARAAALACVRHVHVLGITSGDIGPAHAWENILGPLWRNRLTYWSIGKKASWLRLLGRGARCRTFSTPGELTAALPAALAGAEHVYLSIDKDVFAPDVVRTNWDQGVFRFEHAAAVIRACSGKLAGCDVTGDISEYRYRSLFKRLLSRLDGQGFLGAEFITLRQTEQRELNTALLALLMSALTKASEK